MSILPTEAPRMFGARYIGDKVDILYPNAIKDIKVSATLLGVGRFTRAFRLNGTIKDVILYTFFEDFSKSILSQSFREFGSYTYHLPRIARLGRIYYRERAVNVYRAKYYKPLPARGLSKRNEEIIDTLQDAHEGASLKFAGNIIRSRRSDDFNAYIAQAKGLPDSVRLALEHLMFTAQDWGDHYLFDNFHTRNLGLDSRGRLVFLDPMFDMDKIQKDFDKRQRRQAQMVYDIDNLMS